MFTKQSDNTNLSIKEILKYRETDGFFCDEDFNVWHKGNCFGNIWKIDLWKEEDRKLFECS